MRCWWPPGTCWATVSSTAIPAPTTSPNASPPRPKPARSDNSKPSDTASPCNPSPTPHNQNPPPPATPTGHPYLPSPACGHRYFRVAGFCYVQRWLQAPPAQPNGTLVARDRATPQSCFFLQDRHFRTLKRSVTTKFSAKSKLALLPVRWELVRLACHARLQNGPPSVGRHDCLVANASDACDMAQHCSLLAVAIETAKPHETDNPYIAVHYILFR